MSLPTGCHSYSPILGSSTPQNLPDCLFLALVQGSLASCQPGEENFGRSGHKFPRQVTGQAQSPAEDQGFLQELDPGKGLL